MASANLSELGFEILDLIFSHFSNNPSSSASAPSYLATAAVDDGYSHYENQQNLLNFCMVCKSFYNVARLHLSRYIPIASTFKARQVLSLCASLDSSSASSPIRGGEVGGSFGSRVHSLLLIWPDQGKYSTRRTSIITRDEFYALLSSFPSLRSLELIFLPFTAKLDGVHQATLASTGALDNIRSLNLKNSPYQLRNEEYAIVPSLLVLLTRLESLILSNIPLNAIESIIDIHPPAYRLKQLSIKISSARILEPALLEWMLERSIEAGSCKELTVWLSKRCTDIYNEFNPNIHSVKEDEGFADLQIPLSRLAPSLKRLSMMGLRTGQASDILSKTTANLKVLQLYDTFGFGNDLLADLPFNTGLERLEMLPNPGVAFGAAVPAEAVAPGSTSSAAAARRNGASQAAGGRGGGRQQGTLTGQSGTSPLNGAGPGGGQALLSSSSSNIAGASLSAADASANNASTEDPAQPHSWTEIPVSSHSFISELGPGNRLSKLKVVKIPDNARFGRRGKWLNKELIKACRRAGVWIEEIKM